MPSGSVKPHGMQGGARPLGSPLGLLEEQRLHSGKRHVANEGHAGDECVAVGDDLGDDGAGGSLRGWVAGDVVSATRVCNEVSISISSSSEEKKSAPPRWGGGGRA